MMKRIYSYFQGIKGILLLLYLQFILSADVYLSDLSVTIKWVLYLLILGMLILLCPLLIRGLRKLSIRHKEVLKNRTDKVLWFFSFFLASLAVLLLYYAAFYPGGFSADSVNQYKEAISGTYSDWHPYLHTILFFTVPLKLTGGWVGSVVLFQVIAFSAALAYSSYTVLKHSNIGYALFSLVFVLLNSVTECMSVYPWKDTGFAITVLLLSAFGVNIWFSKGTWLKRLRHIFVVLAVLIVATMIRHNGIFFTLPYLIAIALYCNKKAAVSVFACFLTAVILIKIPLAAALGVERPEGRVEEALGLPMTVIGEVAARNPDAMTDEMREFVYEVAPQEYWENYFQTGSFNSIKFYPETDYYRIDDEGVFKVLGYMFTCFFKAPEESFRSLIALTDMVYTVTGDITWVNIYPGVIDNDVGIIAMPNAEIWSMVSYVLKIINFFFERIFWCVGSMNLVLIACMLSKLRLRKKEEWRRILLVGSMLTYNFGTMLMLTGADFRFFYLSFVITPVLLLIVMREKEKPPVSEQIPEPGTSALEPDVTVTEEAFIIIEE